jgi:hypothetical protein
MRAAGKPALPQAAVCATQNANCIDIDTGALQCRIPGEGANFIESLKIAGRETGQSGRLVAVLENRVGPEGKGALHEEIFVSRIRTVTLEQAGPVRAVVKIEGNHQASGSGRSWLLFTLRLYFYAGLDSVHMVHFFVFDGDQEKDFVRGRGARFSVPMIS